MNKHNTIKQNIVRCFAAVSVLALLFSLCACSSQSKKKSTKKVTSSEELTIPFSSADSTDPYVCQSESNTLLSGLIYESLFSIKEDRTPAKLLAHSYTIQEKTITVKLSDSKFSDGSPLSSEDVVHSFNKAKQSPRYKAALSVFSDAQKKGNSVVRFILSSKNIYALNLLTFPIVCQKNNYLGTGPYKLSEADGTQFLEYNKYHSGKKPKIEKIALLECRDYSNAVNLFNDGKIDFLFDELKDGNVRSNAILSQKAPMNNFLFIGLNSKKGMFKSKTFRAAISTAINQTELCADALQGFAGETATPFDSAWNEIGAIVSNSVLSKESEARALFEKAGCEYDKMEINLTYGGKDITLQMVVNSANNMKIALAELIKAQLVNYGISVDIKKMPLDEYNIAVENESFDMYIGEVKISNDFNLDCFFTDEGGAHFGMNNDSLQQTYLLFKGGNASLQEFVSEFSEQNPFIPVGYKKADVCFNSALKVSGTITENNIYANIEEWSR